MWTADDNNPISYRAPEALFNASIGFSAADDRYSMSIWGRNLTRPSRDRGRSDRVPVILALGIPRRRGRSA